MRHIEFLRLKQNIELDFDLQKPLIHTTSSIDSNIKDLAVGTESMRNGKCMEDTCICSIVNGIRIRAGHPKSKIEGPTNKVPSGRGLLTMSPRLIILTSEMKREDNHSHSLPFQSEQAEKEAKAKVKRREADTLRLKALQLQREEIELQEKALREAPEADDTVVITKPRKDRRGYNEEDEFDSDSNLKRKHSET
ncbi:hypothetical protein AgCh_039877 [Apium graveolens]